MPPSTNPPADANLSPAMRQYFGAKAAHPDTIVFFRMGDFYELFYDDAILVARELQLTLTARDRAREVPMCGVPYHAAAGYLQKLLRKGYKVAICEQMEDPRLAKGVVKREVTRVLTPGTNVDGSLEASRSQWLAAVATSGSACVGIASIDLSTGEMRATEFTGPDAWPQALDELSRMRPAETLFPRAANPTQSRQRSLAVENDDTVDSSTLGARTELDDWVFTADYALPLLQQGLRVHSLDGMGLANHTAAATAAGAIVHYLRATKQGTLAHLDTVRFYEKRGCLELDAVTVRNLELVDPLFSSDGADTTLAANLDHCLTPMGKRLLRAQLVRPMSDLAQINARLDAVACAAADLRRRETLRKAFEGILDLERLLGRVALDSAGPRDVAALSATLRCLPNLRLAAADLDVDRFSEIVQTFDPLADLDEIISLTLADEPPVTLGDRPTIRTGVDPELDELRSLSTTGRERIAAIEERERERTGIGSLKVRFNGVFGYFIEITKANLRSVPADYERRQTLVNAERFTTPELKDLETRILTAQERSSEIESRLFVELRRQILAQANRLRSTARHIAELDLLAAFAHLAALHGWTRPTVDDSLTLEIVQGRHPVVERRLEATGQGRFVPNSLSLCAHSSNRSQLKAEQELTDRSIDSQLTTGQRLAFPSLLLITGPNMGGKSTYLRQAALLTLLAHCGSFVPAERMRVGLVDRIYTRIGASDNVARGRSTFMVEMTETAAILNTATDRSLVLLDEMGRGTATYDGLSLAWATVEHLHDRAGARTLFATHYHELTLLADRLPRLANARVTVRERDAAITFLHTVEPGAANKSYGIEVARLAGLPQVVIDRAREVLRVHERAEATGVREAAPTSPERTPALQMTMFTPLSQRIVDRLAELDLDNLTPREALALLAELQAELREA